MNISDLIRIMEERGEREREQEINFFCLIFHLCAIFHLPAIYYSFCFLHKKEAFPSLMFLQSALENIIIKITEDSTSAAYI